MGPYQLQVYNSTYRGEKKTVDCYPFDRLKRPPFAASLLIVECDRPVAWDLEVRSSSITLPGVRPRNHEFEFWIMYLSLGISLKEIKIIRNHLAVLKPKSVQNIQSI